ncbi:hypothetical protein Pth03_45040 [Planotetraspora thailandica]|uniref:Lipoprotein n=1 Tax=Planotetraspora thailandica TaxID=487172 RepID=A0A8J3VDX8_9ACTN|nr:hypothetical protein [Planotetraspora thailandica]GII56115.1 hypothetical protein Pth03_45040 [Planotetraspora thailandica]
MRTRPLLTAALAAAAVTACSSGQSNSASTAASAAVPAAATTTAAPTDAAVTTTAAPTNAAVTTTAAPTNAAAVIKALAGEGLPIKLTVTYNERNDPNKLLGRPGGYIAKAAFTDKRIKPSDVLGADKGSVDLGGGVEVFPDAAGAKARADYIQSIAKSSPMFAEYDYAKGNVVVRVSKEIAPSDAKAYQAALNKIVP